jgi:hypothetical protein
MDDFKQYTDSPEDLQRMVDTIVRGLRSQGFEQSRGISACAVRGTDGRKCAAGWLLPDELYCDAMEAIGAVYDTVLARSDNVSEETFLAKHHELLKDLQNAHDGAGFGGSHLAPWEVESRLKAVVEKHELQWPEG